MRPTVWDIDGYNTLKPAVKQYMGVLMDISPIALKMSMLPKFLCFSEGDSVAQEAWYQVQAASVSGSGDLH